MYDLTKDMLTEVIAGYIELAKKMKGELVILNKIDDEADEFLITNLKDFNLIKINNGDLIEVTIYVDDEDEVYEEFKIGTGKDYNLVKERIISKLPKSNLTLPTKKTGEKEYGKELKTSNKDSKNNHFQKFMKKNN
ncbi:hypothetical protein [Cetobacterium sp.]|uniref:hypothetical protein n=1 Tax=Cetobacterium sp. TaxID=2071632 RepID=UPI002FC8D21B